MTTNDATQKEEVFRTIYSQIQEMKKTLIHAQDLPVFHAETMDARDAFAFDNMMRSIREAQHIADCMMIAYREVDLDERIPTATIRKAEAYESLAEEIHALIRKTHQIEDEEFQTNDVMDDVAFLTICQSLRHADRVADSMAEAHFINVKGEVKE